MGIDSFEQARTLGRDALNALLASDRPEQRVWAIWSIALSLGDGAGGFAQRVDHEPDPGVRRTLAVILASHGETELLVALARHDPSLAVRESAIQLVVRLAAGAPTDALRASIDEAVGGEPSIRVAMLGAIGHGAPAFLVAITHHLLAATDAEVQAEAFETLLRLDTPDARNAARTWFLRRPDPWNLVDRWLRGADMMSLAEAVAGAQMNVRGQILIKLRSPPWPVVELLVGDDLELLRAMLSRTDVAIPARVLARAVRGGAHQGFASRLAAQLATAARGRVLLADLRAAIEHDDVAASLLPGLAERTRTYADALELVDRHEVFYELAELHPVEHLLGLENAVARWLVEFDAPADLLPLLPELRRYCADHLETLLRTGVGRRSRRRQAQLGAGYEPVQPNEQELFRDLLAALERIAERS